MHYQYCPHCGTKLAVRELGDNGLIPWCESCNCPLFDTFSCCVIALVTDGTDQVVLLRQPQLSQKYMTLVSGYMQPEETAEQAIVREIREELGVDVKSLRIVQTFWMEQSDMLMIGFIAIVDHVELKLSGELEAGDWFSVQQARTLIHPPYSVSGILLDVYIKNHLT